MNRKAKLRKIINNIKNNMTFVIFFMFTYLFINIIYNDLNHKINLFIDIVVSIYIILWTIITKIKLSRLDVTLDFDSDDDIKSLFLILLYFYLLFIPIILPMVIRIIADNTYLNLNIFIFLIIILLILFIILFIIFYKYEKKWIIEKGGWWRNSQYMTRSNIYSIGSGETDNYYSCDNKYKNVREFMLNFKKNALKRGYYEYKLDNIIYYFRNYDFCFNIYAFCDKMTTKDINKIKSNCKNIILELLEKKKDMFQETFINQLIYLSRSANEVSYNFTIILLNEEVDEEFLNEIEFFEVNGKDGMFIPMIINDKSINYMNYFRGQMNVNYNYAIKEFKKLLKLK